LRRHNDPRPAPALGGQTFSHGLQVGHEFGVLGHVLAHFVHKEVQPEVVWLLVQPFIDLVAKVLNGQCELLAVLIQNAFCVLGIGAAGLGIGFGNVGRLQQGLLPATLPLLVANAAVGIFKGLKLTTAV
jgi:hypothetical protein